MILLYIVIFDHIFSCFYFVLEFRLTWCDCNQKKLKKWYQLYFDVIYIQETWNYNIEVVLLLCKKWTILCSFSLREIHVALEVCVQCHSMYNVYSWWSLASSILYLIVFFIIKCAKWVGNSKKIGALYFQNGGMFEESFLSCKCNNDIASNKICCLFGAKRA